MSLLVSFRTLVDPPTEFVDGPTQRAFDHARDRATKAARARLNDSLSIPLLVLRETPEAEAHRKGDTEGGDNRGGDNRGGDNRGGDNRGGDTEGGDNRGGDNRGGANVRRGLITGFRPADIDPLATVEHAVRSAWGPSRSRAFLASTEATATLDQPVEPEGEDPVDPRAAYRLLRHLDDGWQLRVTEPAGLPIEVAAMVDDLHLAFEDVTPTLVFGIRSALGAPPVASPHSRLLLQLAGARAVLAHDGENHSQFPCGAGQLAAIRPTIAVSHLPLDGDSLHLEVTFNEAANGDSPASTHEARAANALRLTRTTTDVRTARGVVAADPAAGWPMRLAAPGGVQVTSDSDDHVEVAVGASQLVLTRDGADLLIELADSRYVTGAELAERTGAEPSVVVGFCEELWGHGLLQAASSRSTAVGGNGERLTQVASTETTFHERALGLVDESAWRPAEPGEVHHSDSIDVAVQSVDMAQTPDLLKQLTDMATAMNSQFFGADIDRIDAEDGPILVRVRAGEGSASAATESWTDAIASDVTMLGHRKVTFVLSLSEATGGWLYLPAGSNTARSEQGAFSAWLSLRPWTIEPVTEGERLFLLGRIHGPAFR